MYEEYHSGIQYNIRKDLKSNDVKLEKNAKISR